MGKSGESYANILKKIKSSMNTEKYGTEVINIRRTKQQDLIVFNKGDNITKNCSELQKLTNGKVDVKNLIVHVTLEIKNTDEMSIGDEVVQTIQEPLGMEEINVSINYRMVTRCGNFLVTLLQMMQPQADKTPGNRKSKNCIESL